ncbi:hypothetical protein [Elstera litoralis]|uniref:hypothetical protein n=1 Tax=Elstera litoralis TaxID=552518 RepID=UPI000AB7AB7E|nr:hypothetical protein [Elstera litoralis]
MADKIAHSRHPIILAGFEAARCGAAAAVTLLMDQQRIPVITTYKAKGLVPEDHPLSLGGAGLSPKADTILLELIGKADLVLTIGYDPIEMRVGWLDAFPATAQVIDLTDHPADHGMHRVDQQVIGPLPGTIAALNWALGKGSPPPHWAAGQAVAARAALQTAFAPPLNGGRTRSSPPCTRLCRKARRLRSIAVRIGFCSAKCGRRNGPCRSCSRQASVRWARPYRWRLARRGPGCRGRWWL